MSEKKKKRLTKPEKRVIKELTMRTHLNEQERKTIKERLFLWINGILRCKGNFEDYVQVKDTEHHVTMSFFTSHHIYEISASKTYLGCVVINRKPLAGEKHHRFADLYDGRFNKSTWRLIKNDILASEMVELAESVRLERPKRR